MQTLNAKTTFLGQTAPLRQSATKAALNRASVVVHASQAQPVASRRAALGLAAAAAVLATRINPAQAEYGEAARVFASKITNKSGFLPYAGEGFALLLPSKWNPSKEKELDSVVLRYEDNFDAVNNLLVVVTPTSKSSIDAYGPPDNFLKEVAPLLGEQSYSGKTSSEGGFQANRVSAASLLDVSEDADKNGLKYYNYELLVRTADGNEGGRHQLIKATVKDGKLYVLKVQVGDKRWFKGAKKEAEGSLDSFTVV